MIRNQKYVIFDLDGTLACGKHRLHALPTENVDKTWAWDEFNLLADADSPIKDNIELCNLLYKEYIIVILTGRCDVARDITEKWLEDNNVLFDLLIMRPSDDNRTDVIYKEEELLGFGLDNILCAFDDLEHVADMIRGLGVTCHLVTKYEEKRVDNTPREVK